MQIHISSRNGVPVYLQIVSQVKYLVASGRLKPGDELPPIRTLAQQLVITPNTVARAYRELEAAGIVASRQGAGTYITDAGSPLARRERTKILAQHIDALLAEANQMDFDLDNIITLLRQRHSSMRAEREEQRQ